MNTIQQPSQMPHIVIEDEIIETQLHRVHDNKPEYAMQREIHFAGVVQRLTFLQRDDDIL